MYLPGGVGAQTVHNHPEITLTEPSVRVAPKKAQKKLKYTIFQLKETVS